MLSIRGFTGDDRCPCVLYSWGKRKTLEPIHSYLRWGGSRHPFLFNCLQRVSDHFQGIFESSFLQLFIAFMNGTLHLTLGPKFFPLGLDLSTGVSDRFDRGIDTLTRLTILQSF